MRRRPRFGRRPRSLGLGGAAWRGRLAPARTEPEEGAGVGGPGAPPQQDRRGLRARTSQRPHGRLAAGDPILSLTASGQRAGLV